MFKISKQLELPDDAVTQAFGILGRRGSGKTNTAVVMAEEMLHRNHPIVVLDPLGVWWGLRSSADGKGAGYSVAVFGGDHADMPLLPTAGKVVADFIVADRLPVILDVSKFGENDMRRFVADFATQFYRENKEAIHWFVDEADEFAPQNVSGGPGAACLGAMQNICRRGRVRGIGVTLISQRSAVINKSCLTQAECLIAHQTTGPRDLKAIREWFEYHEISKSDLDGVMRSITGMSIGEAWVYSPAWLKILSRVQVRPRHTFDSSRTPKAGESRREPKHLADVDLSRVQTQMAATVEAAKANDPKELRKEIAALKLQLKAGTVDPNAIAQAEARGEQRGRQAAESELKQLRGVVAEREGRLSKVDGLAAKIVEQAHLNGQAMAPVAGPVSTFKEKVVQRHPVSPAITERIARPKKEADSQTRPSTINRTQQRILDALAWFESIGVASPRNLQVGAIALIDSTGGHFSNTVGPLSTTGLIERGDGSMQLTDAGRAVANAPANPPTMADYHNMLRERVRRAKSAGGKTVEMLNAMLAQGGDELTVEEMGEAVGIDHTGGHFSNMIGPLGTLGLVERNRGTIRPTDLLFPEGLQ